MKRPSRRRARTQSRPAIPVVLPLVEISGNGEGVFSVTVDGASVSSDRAVPRAGIPEILDEIARSLDSPIRVEICEADGSVYTDIVTTPSEPEAVEPHEAGGPLAICAGTGIFGSGFQPGEEVAVAVVINNLVADSDGATHLRLPAALADDVNVVLAGRRSGVLAVCGVGS